MKGVYVYYYDFATAETAGVWGIPFLLSIVVIGFKPDTRLLDDLEKKKYDLKGA